MLSGAKRKFLKLKSPLLKKREKTYDSRSAEVQTALNGMPQNHPRVGNIKELITEAQKSAKDGDHKAANATLQEALNKARNPDEKAEGDFLLAKVREKAQDLENRLGRVKPRVDAFYTQMRSARSELQQIVPCREMADLDLAIAHRKYLNDQLPNHLGIYDAAREDMAAARKAIVNGDLSKKMSELRAALRELIDRGYENDLRDVQVKAEDIKKQLMEGGAKYLAADDLNKFFSSEFEWVQSHLLQCKDLSGFSEKVDDTDAATEQARAGLNKLSVEEQTAVLEREEARLQAARERYREERAIDTKAMAMAAEPQMGQTRTLVNFAASDVLPENRVDPNADPTDEITQEVVAAASNAMSALLADETTPQSVLLDLVSKTEDDIKKDILAEIYSGKTPETLSPAQLKLVDDLAAELTQKINAESPNSVTEGGEVLKVGNKTFMKQKVLAKGGFGMATLYMAEDGERLVMKSLLKAEIQEEAPLPEGAAQPSEEDLANQRAERERQAEQARVNLIHEMGTMILLQEGATGRNGSSAIPEFKGAARGEDGKMHMLMEFVEGGDLKDISNRINAVASIGVIPPAARAALQADLVAKTAKGLAELHKLGLLHHDIKEENVMMKSNGEIRIIDYGEAAFVNEQGVTGTLKEEFGNRPVTARDRDVFGGQTPGYLGKDGLVSNATTVADNYSLGSMLINMVSLETPTLQSKGGGSTAERTSVAETGALGRLVQGLRRGPTGSAPDGHAGSESNRARVSLEGLAQSAFITAAENDYGPKEMDELRKAATEFAQDCRGVKSTKSAEEFLAALGDEAAQWQRRFKDNMGLDDLEFTQKLINSAASDIMIGLSNPDRVAGLNLTKETSREAWVRENEKLYNVIVEISKKIEAEKKEALNRALGAAERAYEEAMASDAKFQFDVMGRKAQLDLKSATQLHDRMTQAIEKKRKEALAVLTLQALSPEQMQTELDKRNTELVSLDNHAKNLQAQIEANAGPDAKLHFSKARLDLATAPFGPSRQQRDDDPNHTLTGEEFRTDQKARTEEAAAQAYELAMARDTKFAFEVMGRKAQLDLKSATQLHGRMTQAIEKKRQEAEALRENDALAEDQLQVELNRRNTELESLVSHAENLQKQIELHAGPDARPHFRKVGAA